LKTRAAVLEALNEPLIIDEVEIPKLGVGQVLVEIHKSGICGAQIGEITGAKGEDRFLPHLLGHEGGGIVIDTGPGVTTVKNGDHVTAHWRKGTGIESDFPKYKSPGGRIIGAGLIATFADYSVISENRLTRIDDDIPFNIAALMGCSVMTGLGIINNDARLKIGQSIAVIGVGGVGLNLIQGAKMVSGNPIIAIDIHNKKLGMAADLGATHVINSTGRETFNFRNEIEKIVGLKGVDVFIDTTGRVNMIENAYNLTAENGLTIMVGQPRHDHHLTIHAMARNFTGKRLIDSQGGKTDPGRDIPRYLNLYKDGRLKFDGFIKKEYPLAKINEAIKGMIEDETPGRCILRMKGAEK